MVAVVVVVESDVLVVFAPYVVDVHHVTVVTEGVVVDVVTVVAASVVVDVVDVVAVFKSL